MLRLSLALALAAAVVPFAAHAAVPIHAYEFDGDASDSAGSADGVLVAGASIAAGRLVLDGADDYVAFSSNLVPTSGAYSVFIRLNGTPNLGTFTEIISQGSSGGPGFFIGTAAGGNFRLTDNFLNTGVAFPAGEAELLLTSGGSGTRFYINGTLAFSSASAATIGAAGSPTYFGRQFAPFSEYFSGSIDAIRIYDSAILPGDVVDNVPEPASWSMLIAGFGLIGAVARRQRQRAAA